MSQEPQSSVCTRVEMRQRHLCGGSTFYRQWVKLLNIVKTTYLHNSLKRSVALFISSRLLKILANTNILPQENLSVLLKPVKNLLYILLEEPQRQSLMEFDLLGVPLVLQLPMMGQDVVDDWQHVTGAFLIVSSRIHRLWRRSRFLKNF